MKNFYRHVAIISLTIGAIGFMLLCFMTYKICTLTKTVGYLSETLSGWDSNFVSK